MRFARANPMIEHVLPRGRGGVRPRAARCTRMSYTLAEAAAAPSDFAECSLVALSRDRAQLLQEIASPSCLAAESALATLPPQRSLGDGAVYRTVEPIWLPIFYPAAKCAARRSMGRRREETGQQSSSKKASGVNLVVNHGAVIPVNGERTAVQQTERRGAEKSHRHKAQMRLMSACRSPSAAPGGVASREARSGTPGPLRLIWSQAKVNRTSAMMSEPIACLPAM